ncbi:MAG: hypothetical protein ACH346_07990 [Chthoniobacterales bacterium]
MSDESLFPFQSSSLDQLLMPAWAREKDPSSQKSVQKLGERFLAQDSERNNRQASRKRDFNTPGHFNRPRKNNDRKVGQGASHHGEKFSERRNTAPLMPLVTGWSIDFIPQQRIVDDIAKQVKSEAKAYPLFELTRLILEKPDRYEVTLMRLASAEKGATSLFQYVHDGSLWLSEKEALAHVMKKHRDQFYRSEKIITEPPKGNYTCVGICGMSQKLLGPPNHHEYQQKVRELYAERFSHLPLEIFTSRIQLLRDEETLQRWKDEQSSKEEFYPLSAVERSTKGAADEITNDAQKDEVVVVLKNLNEVEEHFKKHHAPKLIVEVAEKVTLSGQAAINFSAPPIHFFVKKEQEELRRFPLRLSHFLAEDLASRGLQIFKAHENITYVSIARPRYLDRSSTPIAENLSAMLAYLETHPKTPRAEQWKELLSLRPLSEEMNEAQREAAVARDLSWLIHQGYVVNYAFLSLRVAERR